MGLTIYNALFSFWVYKHQLHFGFLAFFCLTKIAKFTTAIQKEINLYFTPCCIVSI